MHKVDLKNLSLSRLKKLVLSLGGEEYRVKQLIQWLYAKKVYSIDEMTNIAKDFRDELAGKTTISQLNIAKTFRTKGGTTKFLFELTDGFHIETVLIPDAKRLTLCISSQVGCAMGCVFCATGKMGFKRNLSIAEIINQVLMVQEQLEEGQRLTNVVFMGMGEPLANYRNVLSVVEVLLNKDALAFSPKRITVSTSGLIPEIERFTRGNQPCRLAISLNATESKTRSKIMPINRRYPLHDLLRVCKDIPMKKNEHITFEYVLIDGLNDSIEDARRLVRLLKGIPSKVNLIPLNESSDCSLKRSPQETILAFQAILKKSKVLATLRSSKGKSISGACGQLSTNNPKL
jgi:23S rRNA (adenine2503-C2)-methyltransferase